MTDIALIEAAHARAKGVVRETPLLSSPYLDAIAGRPVWAKAEVLQHTGSFKFRGGWAAVSALPPAERAKGVLAFSSGNHAQGVAYAAALHGVSSIIIMPRDAPALKIANTRALGAEVILYDRAGGEKREEIGARVQAERGLTAGIALALEAHAPGLRVRPVEPEGFDDTARSLAAGQRVGHGQAEVGFCDAILTPMPGVLTYPILARLCGAGIVVAEDAVREAMRLAASRLKLVVEPGGAVALAAALFHGAELADGPVICTLSGGNADPAGYAAILAAG
jgi:threonine dehydratase